MRYMVYGKIFLIGLKMKRIPNVTPLLKDNQELLAKLNDITKVSFLDKNGIIHTAIIFPAEFKQKSINCSKYFIKAPVILGNMQSPP